jgi:hypothetical protein
MLVPFIGKRGSGPVSGIVNEEPNGVYLTERDEATAKKHNA